MKLKISALCVMGAVAFALMAASAAPAKELQYPAACYQGDELKKVQDWEAKWVGKKITSANIDEVKDLLPESFYNTMKDAGKWGDSWFEIVPYKTVSPTPGNIEMTKKYNGETKIGPSGEILGYISGVPFPETKDATEMAHNFRTRSFGDAYENHDTAWIVDGRLKYDMNSEIRNSLAFLRRPHRYAAGAGVYQKSQADLARLQHAAAAAAGNAQYAHYGNSL